MMKKECGNCRFWDQWLHGITLTPKYSGVSEAGTCVRYPQEVTKGNTNRCGEWEAKEKTRFPKNPRPSICDTCDMLATDGTCMAVPKYRPTFCPYYIPLDDTDDDTDSIYTDSLTVAIDHINQFMKKHPAVEIRFSGRYDAVKELCLKVIVDIPFRQYAWSASAHSLEKLLLQLNRGLTFIEDLLTTEDYSQ